MYATAHDESHPVLLHDGQCALCDASVRTVLALDHRARFRFAALESRAAATLCAAVNERAAAAGSASAAANATVDVAGAIPNAPPDSVILVMDGRLWSRSSAVVRVLWALGFPWSVAGTLLWLVPRPLRDALYGWVAANRAAWFGRMDACRRPAPGQHERFLDADER